MSYELKVAGLMVAVEGETYVHTVDEETGEVTDRLVTQEEAEELFRLGEQLEDIARRIKLIAHQQ